MLDPISPDAYSWSPTPTEGFIEAADTGFLLDLADLAPVQERVNQLVEDSAKALYGGFRQRFIAGISQALPLAFHQIPAEGVE